METFIPMEMMIAIGAPIGVLHMIVPPVVDVPILVALTAM